MNLNISAYLVDDFIGLYNNITTFRVNFMLYGLSYN